jgi:hypothetical protein
VYKGKYIPYGPVHMGAKFSQLVAAFQIADTEEARKQLATELVVYLGFYLMDDEPKTPVY